MLRIATRDSDLALWQARHVQDLLLQNGVESKLKPLKTQGDKDQVTPLATLEGKGFFTKELEDALLAGHADLAVHSQKDLPTRLPPGLKVAAVFSRADRREALLIRADARAERQPFPLREGATLGSSSARRMAQVSVLAPDLKLKDIRGNVPTRLRKLREGHYDAVLLAWAGLARLALDLSDLDVVLLPLETFLPAPGQAALAIEIRADDPATEAAVAKLDDAAVRRTVEAERNLLHLFAGGCKLPLGVVAEAEDEIHLQAVYGAQERDGTWTALRTEVCEQTPKAAARSAFTDLLAQKLAWAEARKPLAKLIVAVTRPADKVDGLHTAVERLGGKLLAVPTLAFEPAGDPDRITAALAGLERFHWVLFTSANAVHYFFQEHLQGRGWPQNLKAGAVGAATARALESQGVTAELVGEGGTGGDLADRFLAEAGAGSRVLWPTAENHRRELPDRLIAAGVEIEPLVIYRATLPPAEARVHKDQVRPAWILVTSPQAGLNFVELYGIPEGARWVAIGPTTQAEMQSVLKIPVTVAREASLDALAEVLV
jgi:hydroxymethylbilane synthase